MSYEGRIVYVPREQKDFKPLHKTRWLIYAAVLVLFAISGGAVFVLREPRWQIKNIEVSGAVVLDSEELKSQVFNFLSGNYLFLFPHSSIFILSSESVKKFLEREFPRIERVAVSREFPASLKIHLQERVLWAIFCGAKNCVYVDNNGVAYEEAPSSSGSLILKITSDKENLAISAKLLDDLTLGRMNLISRGLQEKLQMRVVGFELFSKVPGEIRVAVSDGFKIYLNRADDLEKVFEVLKRVLAEEIKEKRDRLEYIDARFGNKVFYKLK